MSATEKIIISIFIVLVLIIEVEERYSQHTDYLLLKTKCDVLKLQGDVIEAQLELIALQNEKLLNRK
jgi:hypothetical protein